MKRGRKSKFKDDNTLNNWNVALYIRLSVQDGDKEESNSVANQKELLDMFMKNNKNLIYSAYYIDDGYSGGNFDRPEFKRMIQDIDLGLVNTVIVKDLSRLGRNYIGVGKYIQIFLQKNIRFISVCDNIDSFLNPKSIEVISFPLKNLINEYYCRDISKKISTAFSVMKKKGKFIGSCPPFGYIKEKEDKHHLIIDSAAATVVKLIFDLCESGSGNTLIASELNRRGILTPSEYNYKILKSTYFKNRISKEWTASMVGKILDNRVYCGDLVQNKSRRISYKVHKKILNNKEDYIIVENTHEPIIDKKRFFEIQELRKNRKFNWNKRVDDISIFKGLVLCGSCGKPMNLVLTNKKEINEIKIKKYAFKCDECNKEEKKDFYIKADTLKTCIFKSIKYHIDLLNNFQEAKKAIKPNTKYTENLKGHVKNMKVELESLSKVSEDNYISWKNNEISEKEYMEKIKTNITKECLLQNSIREEKDKLLKAKLEIKNIKDNIWVDTLLKYKNQREITKEMLNDLIDKIYIFNEGRKIRIKFKYEDAYKLALNYLKIVKKGGNINA